MSLIDSVNTEVLINCTIETVEKFPFTPLKNNTDLFDCNRSQIIEHISEMITKTNGLYIDADSGSTVK